MAARHTRILLTEVSILARQMAVAREGQASARVLRVASSVSNTETLCGRTIQSRMSYALAFGLEG